MKNKLLRTGLLLVATALLLIVLPRADHQSYTYELNQPWRYPLLTAEFDVPIMRDSASAHRLRDSIEANFIPFVVIDKRIENSALQKLTNADIDIAPGKRSRLVNILADVYKRGILSQELNERISHLKTPAVRVMDNSEEQQIVRVEDAGEIFSQAKAYAYIDSLYTSGSKDGAEHLTKDMAKALSGCIIPNIILDRENDDKYRSQEYLGVNGATGVIKKGQRIVDRGEIINAQIFTNLNTYIEMLDRQAEKNTVHTYYYIGQALYILVCFLALYFFLMFYRPHYYYNKRKLIFLMSFITLFVIYSIIMFEYIRNGIFLVPFAAVPVIVMVFLDNRTAIFSLLITVLLSALIATYQLQFVFLELMAGLWATYSIRQLSKRSQLLNTAWVTFLVYIVTYVAIMLLSYGNLDEISWKQVMYFAINSVILSFDYVLIFVVEKIFGFTSMVTLVELSDINNPLLRRLAEEAPGTFQHSMQVSTLASEAARSIGANTQLVRTGALYHDIGKLESPVFFTENQHGINPHTGLDPETSAQKIISHVTAGVTLAKEAKLPTVIRDFIKEHHGKGVTRYFYNTAVNESNGRPVDRSLFEYPGPNPKSKETTILMMADSVEAASRSLKDYSAASINTLVDKIIDGQMADGLYKDSPISFKDIETVKDTFKRRLATIYHSRIAYPEIKTPSDAQPHKESTDK